MILFLLQGIISDYPDGTFKPENTINVAEAFKIILNTFALETEKAADSEEWYATFVRYAQEHNLYLDTFDSNAQILTRAEMAELIYRLIK